MDNKNRILLAILGASDAHLEPLRSCRDTAPRQRQTEAEKRFFERGVPYPASGRGAMHDQRERDGLIHGGTIIACGSGRAFGVRLTAEADDEARRLAGLGGYEAALSVLDAVYALRHSHRGFDAPWSALTPGPPDKFQHWVSECEVTGREFGTPPGNLDEILLDAVMPLLARRLLLARSNNNGVLWYGIAPVAVEIAEARLAAGLAAKPPDATAAMDDLADGGAFEVYSESRCAATGAIMAAKIQRPNVLPYVPISTAPLARGARALHIAGQITTHAEHEKEKGNHHATRG